MAYNHSQFSNLITKVLKEVNLYTPSAAAILLGTAAKESSFGTFLRQLNGGPALGPFQIEPATFTYLKYKYQDRFPAIESYTFDQLEYDIKASIIMARLKYFSISGPLPDADDILALAKYWKKYYNTPLGDGTVDQFITAWNKYIK